MALTKDEIPNQEMRMSLAMQIKATRTEQRAKEQLRDKQLQTKNRGDDVRFQMELNKINNLESVWEDL